METVTNKGLVSLSADTFTSENGCGTFATLNKEVTVQGVSRSGTVIDCGGATFGMEISIDSKVTLRSLTMRGAVSSNPWGGACVEVSQNGQLVLDDVLLENCTSSTGNGGAVAVSGLANITITGSTIQFSTSTFGRGGGLFLSSFGTGRTIIENTVFRQNQAVNGGAIGIFGGLLFRCLPTRVLPCTS